MKIIELVNFDDFPDVVEEDETIKDMLLILNHIYIATERSVYVMLEDDEDYP